MFKFVFKPNGFCSSKMTYLEIEDQIIFIWFFEAFDEIIDMIRFWSSPNYYI